jgi:hypothetical protein
VPLLRRWWPELVGLGVVPILMASVLPIQLYPPPGWVDPSLYLGYFLNLSVLLDRFGPDYHVMRLPWVLSGFVVHALLPPVPAHLVLIACYHLLAALSLYLIVAPRHGRLVGVIASLFLTVNPMWIAAVTRGYVDGPGIAFVLAGLAVVANVGAWRTVRVPGVLVGLFATLAAHTHPLAGGLAIAAVVAALATQRLAWRDTLRLTGWACVAALALTLALGAISVSVGGPFRFWLAAAEMLDRSFGGFGANYRRPASHWLPSAYLLFPMIGLLACGVSVLVFRRSGARTSAQQAAQRPRRDVLIIGCALLGVYVSWALVWDFWIGGSMLQASYTLTFAVPGLALVFAGLLAVAIEAWPHRTRRASAALFLACLAAGAVPVLGASWLWSIEAAARPMYLGWVLLTVMTVIAAAVLCARAPAIPVVAAPVLLLFAVSVAGVVNGDTRRIFTVDGNPSYRPFYRAEHRVNAFIRGHLDVGRRIFLWYDRDDFTTTNARTDAWLRYRMRFAGNPLELTVYDNFGSLWLWHRANLGFAMPAFAPDAPAKLNGPQPARVAMFCSTLVRCEDGIRAFERRGFRARLAAQERIVEPPYIDVTTALVDIDRAVGEAQTHE